MNDDVAARKAKAKENADYHVEASRRARERESARAQVIVDDFVRRATEAGLPVQELMARPYRGAGRYRTGTQGWYIQRDRALGVDTDGKYYLLVVSPNFKARFRPMDLVPTPPPLQVGEGARDGESIGLRELLQLRLDAGPDFPLP